ncbi:flagellar filament capping protein FliD [Acetobacterium paludosum]|uniref:Flagellar hook-associated protein 2 n=1 Tax=Acetobacterium paludosum TaxID=52693 RepID=A0A923HW33_9FIRM|nr:flagellar filament capping protein FliD [Acetobacterium paludosum]MBC3888252.1 flagellar filament capping protein FliD [Acetobacterium paludosum]
MATISSLSSSSSSTKASSSLSTSTGIGGLVSGLDTDTIVDGLTLASRTKISKAQQKVDKLGWQQTAYRDVTTELKDFQSKYLDVLSGTNLTSTSAYNTVKASTTSLNVSATATSNAIAGSLTINKITQLAKNETIKSGEVSDGLKSSTSLTAYTDSDVSSLVSALTGKSIKMTLDGTVKTVTFDDTFVSNAGGTGATQATFLSAMQSKMDEVFGTSNSSSVVKATLSTDGNLTFAAAGSQLTVNALNSDKDTLTALGLTDGQTDKIKTTATLADLKLKTPLTGDSYSFSINSVDFKFSSTDSLSSIMDSINASDAGVKMAYSSTSDSLTLTANNGGSGDNIRVTDTDGLFAAFRLTTATGATTTAGQYATLTVNNQDITRSSNDFTIEGVKISLLNTATDESKISLKEDTSALKTTITNFVTDYNTLISSMNGLINETPDKDYQPLTTDQKADMSESAITAWEKKAKVGLLAQDNTLKSITSKMQSIMYSAGVKGGITLYNMGISSAGVDQKGKLTIDSDKLDTALSTLSSSSIKALFTTGTTGIANQLDSVITGAIKTSGAEGSRGSLVELAGYADTTSDTQNSISETITRSKKEIKDMNTALTKEHDHYWSKFTALETAMESLNSQSAMITSFSSGS